MQASGVILFIGVRHSPDSANMHGRPHPRKVIIEVNKSKRATHLSGCTANTACQSTGNSEQDWHIQQVYTTKSSGYRAVNLDSNNSKPHMLTELEFSATHLHYNYIRRFLQSKALSTRVEPDISLSGLAYTKLDLQSEV